MFTWLLKRTNAIYWLGVLSLIIFTLLMPGQQGARKLRRSWQLSQAGIASMQIIWLLGTSVSRDVIWLWNQNKYTLSSNQPRNKLLFFVEMKDPLNFFIEGIAWEETTLLFSILPPWCFCLRASRGFSFTSWPWKGRGCFLAIRQILVQGAAFRRVLNFSTSFFMFAHTCFLNGTLLDGHCQILWHVSYPRTSIYIIIFICFNFNSSDFSVASAPVCSLLLPGVSFRQSFFWLDTRPLTSHDCSILRCWSKKHFVTFEWHVW